MYNQSLEQRADCGPDRQPAAKRTPRGPVCVPLPGRASGSCSSCGEYTDGLHVPKERPLRALCSKCCPCGKVAA